MKSFQYLIIILSMVRRNIGSKKIKFVITVVLIIANFACQDFVEIDPPVTSLTTSTVFKNDATAIAALSGIYNRMVETSAGYTTGQQSITLLSGLLSNEFNNYFTDVNMIEFYNSALTPTNARVVAVWSQIYNHIHSANSVIEGIARSNELTPSVMKQLEGEAKFIRAFLHFYLLNLFGDIPYITSTDYRINSKVKREPAFQVYQYIIADLLSSIENLSDTYVNAGRNRPNKWTARALLSRVYLYAEDWSNAETMATAIIDNTSLYVLSTDLNAVFLASTITKVNQEAIWQIQPVAPDRNTYEGFVFILTSAPNTFRNSVTLTTNMLNAFENGDKRRLNWTNNITVAGNTYFFPYKYKVKMGTPVTEYLMVLRLAEQYLIRAEARTQQNNFADAQADLNVIRNRAGLLNTLAATKSDLLLAIEQERQVELFTEWGHRWFDLKRTNRSDLILGSLKPSWQSTDVLYPLPQAEMSSNPNLTPQNAGY